MSLVSPFHNEPPLELRRSSVRDSLAGALAGLDGTLALEVPVIVAGDRRSVGGREILSTDPGVPDRLVARAAAASDSDVDAAVEAGTHAQRAWGSLPARDRGAALMGAAAWMRDRRLELAALVLRECAKPWPEADADVCEAIDFLEYYARAAIALEEPRPLHQIPGERNELRYVPRGVTAVISPWNFPLAIACGMTAAALAAGNAAVLKPAEQSPGCALHVVEALLAGGVPPAAISLLPGEGEVGASLVRHPGIQTIAFTGSQPVGLEIVRAAAEIVPGQRHIKRVIAELGGKNCVIVAADADLDEAVPAIVSSAFAYGGQKCSAASRVLVCDALADTLMERLAGAVSVLVVGQADALPTQVPALIEASAQERLRSFGEQAEREGRIAARAPVADGPGHFAPPLLVGDLPPSSTILTEELFGPLLAVQRVRDVRQACEIVDGLPFALTGGLFSRSPQTVAEVKERTPVGNLYINRGITGAIVGRQPFGGNRLSGTGSKAGGPDYLLSFVEPRAVSENTMRHGLAM